MTSWRSPAPPSSGSDIVVGIDYSDASELALRHALELARCRADVTLHLLTVAEGRESEHPVELHESNLAAFAAQAHDTLDEYVARVLRSTSEPKLDPDRIRTAVDFGDVEERLRAFAQSMNAALLVVGTHGRAGLDRLLVGSVAEALLRKAPCAVMVVRPGPERR